MPEPNIGSVPFQEAIDHFRSKLNMPTRRYDAMLGEIHAKAFTVAGAINVDLLTDIRESLDQAISNGTTITDFRKQFDETVQKHGWSYKGKRGWRTRVIFDNNLRTAHMAGRWQQFQRVKKTRPFLQYQTAGDRRVRPEHAAWDNKVLNIDDSWWDTHMPPNGWGCRCTVRSLSARQMRRDKLDVDQAPPLENTERISTTTGEVFGDVPKGIDTGWNYNVGKAWLGPEASFGIKLAALPPVIREQALSGAALATMSKRILPAYKKWAKKALNGDKSVESLHYVGYFSHTILNFASKQDRPITDPLIAVTARDLRGMTKSKSGRTTGRSRAKKQKQLVPVDILNNLPSAILNAAALWDVRTQSVIYAFDSPDINKLSKIVVKPRTTKGVARNLIVHGSVVSKESLKDNKSYILIEGKI